MYPFTAAEIIIGGETKVFTWAATSGTAFPQRLVAVQKQSNTPLKSLEAHTPPRSIQLVEIRGGTRQSQRGLGYVVCSCQSLKK